MPERREALMNTWFEEYKLLMEQNDKSVKVRENEDIQKRLAELRKWLGDEYLESRQGELHVKKVFPRK